MVFAQLYNAFLSLNTVWIILIIATLVSFLITLTQKYLSNQRKIKRLKSDIQDLRDEMKDMEDTDELMDVQGRMTSKNLEMMKEKFKPMLYYIIPIILIFSWMGSTLAYQPLTPDQQFNVTLELNEEYDDNIMDITLESTPQLTINQEQRSQDNKEITWWLEGDAGRYTLTFNDGFQTSKDIIISNNRDYTQPTTSFDAGTIRVSNEKVTPLGNLSIFGYRPGWLATYILFSIITGIILRKSMNVA